MMFKIDSLRMGLSFLVLGAASSATAFADGPQPLGSQLTELASQALDQDQPEHARAFLRKALELEPGNVEARHMLDRIRPVRRISLQTDDVAAPADAEHGVKATIEEQARLENVHRQQLTADIEERLQRARELVNVGQPEAALDALRLAQTVVRSDDQVAEDIRNALDRRIQAQILSTARAEERIVGERAEAMRLAAAGIEKQRALDLLSRNQETVATLMTQFDMLMARGQYNVLYQGGFGNIVAATAPFIDARMLAMQARALAPREAAPRAGMFVSQTMGILAQELAYEQAKTYRAVLTFQDVYRAAVPFPDTQVIEYPDAELWRTMSERRIQRYGKAVDLLDRDEKTKSILQKLDEPISMSFANETPLEDVLKYIKSATQGANDTGIPIYVDPVGLQEAEKTLTSPVQLDLEGVPLKTTLRLILKQLGLTYTVKDGMLTITSESSEDQPTEIRVYPVADLAIIPISLMGGGGMGGMGGRGMMGGGMGGMGGGMGGGMMGGGMGGMGGGMGMMSIAPVDPHRP